MEMGWWWNFRGADIADACDAENYLAAGTVVVVGVVDAAEIMTI
jgi:hypothetical protein